jgi:hypothetical protein
MSQENIYGRDYLQKFTRLESIKATWELNKWRATQAMIAQDEYSAQTIIDVGCAAGTFIKSMKSLMPMARVIGVDINPLAVAHCTVGGLEAYTNEMFDFIWDTHLSQHQHVTMTFWDSLEHMRDPAGFLNRYRPKKVLASLPCLDGFLEHFTSFDICLWKHYRPMEHLWHFTADQFVAFMKEAGYVMVSGPMFDECYWRVDPILKDRNIMTFSFQRA